MFMLLTGFPVQMFPLPLCWHLSVRAWLCDQPFFSRLLFHEHIKIPFLLVRNSSSYMCLRQVIGDFISDFEWITEFQQSFLWLTESRTECRKCSQCFCFGLPDIVKSPRPDHHRLLLGSFRVYCVIAAIFSLRFFCLLVLCVILSKS